MKVILISGASRGIGLKIAEQLLEENYILSLGVRNPLVFAGSSFENNPKVSIYPYEATDKQSPVDWVKATIA